MNAPILAPQRPNSFDDRLAEVVKRIPIIEAGLSELFPGPVEVEMDEDPEIAGKRYLVFTVSTRETVQVVLARRLEWYRLKDELLGDDSELASLLVNYVE